MDVADSFQLCVHPNFSQRNQATRSDYQCCLGIVLPQYFGKFSQLHLYMFLQLYIIQNSFYSTPNLVWFLDALIHQEDCCRQLLSQNQHLMDILYNHRLFHVLQASVFSQIILLFPKKS